MAWENDKSTTCLPCGSSSPSTRPRSKCAVGCPDGIDIDPTCDPTYRAQQLTFFNGFYGTYCYLPLVVTISFGRERRK